MSELVKGWEEVSPMYKAGYQQGWQDAVEAVLNELRPVAGFETDVIKKLAFNEAIKIAEAVKEQNNDDSK